MPSWDKKDQQTELKEVLNAIPAPIFTEDHFGSLTEKDRNNLIAEKA